jgi:hypothetical protein
MADANPRTALVVAIIGLVGTLGAALITNWTKIFPTTAPEPTVPMEYRPAASGSPAPARPAEPAPAGLPVTSVRPEPVGRPSSNAPAPNAPASPPAAPAVSLTGVWVDVGAPMNQSEMTQSGQSFSFRRRGALANGQPFEATGTGTIVGLSVNLAYTARYAFNTQSTGQCSGSVSSDGTRLDLQCQDTMLGTFAGTSLRQ